MKSSLYCCAPLLGALFLTACGGGGSGGGGDRDPVSTTDLSGAGVKGPLVAADVTVYQLDPADPLGRGAVLGTGTTGANAAIEGVSLANDVTGPVLVEILANEDTRDLTTGAPPVVARLVTLRDAQALRDSGSVYLTPLSTMAVLLALKNGDRTSNGYSGNGDGTITVDEVMNALAVAVTQVKSSFGFGLLDDVDILAGTPLITESTTDAASQESVLKLRTATEAVVALAAKLEEDARAGNTASTATTEAMFEALIDDLADGQLDGALDGAALDAFVDVADPVASLTVDPSDLYIPGTTRQVSAVRDILEEEMTQTGTDTDTTALAGITADPLPANTEPDSDGDGVPDHLDAFPNDPDEDTDADNDGTGANADPDDGDACVPDNTAAACDSDGDGVPDGLDAFPNDPDEDTDADNDGTGANADPDDSDACVPDNTVAACDSDGDGVPDGLDAFPNDPNEDTDADNDGTGANADPDDSDACVPDNTVAGCDSDGDGVPDGLDAFPDDPDEDTDADSDGIGANADPDDSNACVPDNTVAACDSDGDGVPDGLDAFPNDPDEDTDADSDGTGANADPDDNDACTPDNTVAACDSDGDGVPDGLDAFPNDPDEDTDADSDGTGANADPDDNDACTPDNTVVVCDTDGDGVPDGLDAFPNDPNEDADADNDGTGANADPDDNDACTPDNTVAACDTDGDGVPDGLDDFPEDPARSVDMDARITFPSPAARYAGVPFDLGVTGRLSRPDEQEVHAGDVDSIYVDGNQAFQNQDFPEFWSYQNLAVSGGNTRAVDIDVQLGPETISDVVNLNNEPLILSVGPIVRDSANNRLLVLDMVRGTLHAVNLSDNSISHIIGPGDSALPVGEASTGYSDPPIKMALDATGQRLFYATFTPNSGAPGDVHVYEVDLAAGTHEEIFGPETGTGPTLEPVTAMAWEPVHGNLIMTDLSGSGLLFLDPASGEMTVDSGLGGAVGLIPELENNRIYALDEDGSILVLDMNETGDTIMGIGILVENSLYDAYSGDGFSCGLLICHAFQYDPAAGRFVVAELSANSYIWNLYEVVVPENWSTADAPLPGSAISLLNHGESGSGDVVTDVAMQNMVLSADGQTAYMAGVLASQGFINGGGDIAHYPGVLAVSLVSDERADMLPQTRVGAGKASVPLAVQGLVMNPEDQSLLIASTSQCASVESSFVPLLRISVGNGARTCFQEEELTGPLVNTHIPISLDTVGQDVYALVEQGLECELWKESLATGTEELISSSTVGEGPVWAGCGDVVYDHQNQRVLVAASDSIFAVDPLTGDRSQLFQHASQSADLSSLTVDPLTNDLAYVYNNSSREVLSVTLGTDYYEMLSDNVWPSAEPPHLHGHVDLAYDPHLKRLLATSCWNPWGSSITDDGGCNLMQIDVDTGGRAQLAGQGDGQGAAEPFYGALAFDSASQTAFVLGMGIEEIGLVWGVDVAPGSANQRAVISR